MPVLPAGRVKGSPSTRPEISPKGKSVPNEVLPPTTSSAGKDHVAKKGQQDGQKAYKTEKGRSHTLLGLHFNAYSSYPQFCATFSPTVPAAFCASCPVPGAFGSGRILS